MAMRQIKLATIIVLLSACTAYAGGDGAVTIKGSDTMLPLNRALVERYQRNVSNRFVVLGGGSSIGIEGLINGTAEICAVSRPLNHEEVERVRKSGAPPVPTPIGLDGITIAVNGANTVRSLTLDQIQRIYSGEVTNWKSVGGADLRIVAFARDKNSGTLAFMKEHVMKSKDWGRDVRFVPSTAEELREIVRTPGGISFGGLAYFKGKPGVRIVPVAEGPKRPAIMPNELTVRSHTYPIWRTLIYVTKGKTSSTVQGFLKFVLSPEGQSIVEKSGFVRLRASR